MMYPGTKRMGRRRENSVAAVPCKKAEDSAAAPLYCLYYREKERERREREREREERERLEGGFLPDAPMGCCFRLMLLS